MNEVIPHESSCGARTRSGGKCRRKPTPGRTRCNLHGGKFLFGIAHPNYKHGLYSKHCLIGVMLRARIKAAKRIERKLAKYEASGAGKNP